MRILITGGAGFVGSRLALSFKKENPLAEVVSVDNLKRRGSELNLVLFKQLGIKFVHGDIRSYSDLEDLPGDWVANHYFNKPLKYTGFGGSGKQVWDLLHPSDLFSLIRKQLSKVDSCSGEVFNIGGGREVSISLCELTALCQEAVGRQVPITNR